MSCPKWISCWLQPQKYNVQTQDANGGIQQVSVGTPAIIFPQTITIASVDQWLGPA